MKKIDKNALISDIEFSLNVAQGYFPWLNKLTIDSLEGLIDVLEDQLNYAHDQGYHIGYDEGYEAGSSDGYDEGYGDGKDE